jgi:arylsulfatase
MTERGFMRSVSRRITALVSFLGALRILIFTTLALGASMSLAQNQKPNIVFILVANLGYGELGVYRGGILRGAPTPRIDKLASERTRLLN